MGGTGTVETRRSPPDPQACKEGVEMGYVGAYRQAPPGTPHIGGHGELLGRFSAQRGLTAEVAFHNFPPNPVTQVSGFVPVCPSSTRNRLEAADATSTIVATAA